MALNIRHSRLTAPAAPVSTWPGPTNTGHLNAPGYPGALTPYTGSAFVPGNTTYSFRDFYLSDVAISVPNVTFYGCRFQSNWTGGWITKVLYDAPLVATFKFCTFGPMAAFGSAPPNAAWPSAGLGLPIDGSTDGGYEPYMIPYSSSYQYGIIQDTGGILVEDCNIWGFGNSICFFGYTYQNVVRRCWIHDAGAEGSGSSMYHQDGPGHLNNYGCGNVLIEDCTIASLGNTNAIAFQEGTNGYTNIIVRRNYLSGFSTCIDMCHNGPGPCTGLQFVDNTIATDIGWRYNHLYANYDATFSQPSNVWRGNRFKVYPGTYPRPDVFIKYTAADDGKFVLPSGQFSTTDYE